jgi:hypothetical protein
MSQPHDRFRSELSSLKSSSLNGPKGNTMFAAGFGVLNRFDGEPAFAKGDQATKNRPVDDGR